jgi:quinoprotein glucose dehydrogenase
MSVSILKTGLFKSHLVNACVVVTIFALLSSINYLTPYQVQAFTNQNDEWSAYGRDAGGSRYSPLTQINRKNVNQLKVAWEFHTGASEIKGKLANKAAFEATPLLVDGTLYLTTPFSRVIALDPTTGKERWSYDPKPNLSLDYSEVTSRGVSTWADKNLRPAAADYRRIILATLDARLIALNAKTGEPCKDFGLDGQVDLTNDVRLKQRGQYQVTSPPAIIGDLIVVGSSMGDNRGVELERGVVRAYNARTGKLLWSWDPIPTSDKDPAFKTWKGEGAKQTGAANAWSIISADPERDLIFVPTSSPSPDFYGGERLGDNAYANSVVALRASTGRVVWHFQVVHHDLWDYDVAAQPMLININRGGRNIPAVAVATKMGHIFVLHRETGKPLFPVEERAVPKSTIPGEETSPTQPFPVLPRPIAPSKLSPDDAWGLTPADKDWCRERIKSLRSEGIFTPPSFEGTIMFPGNGGGVNWGGMAFDAKRNLLIAATNRLPFAVKLIPRDEFSRMHQAGETNRFKGEFGWQAGTPYVMYREIMRSPSGTPCNPPPWGALTAIDLTTGETKWEVPLGQIPQIAMLPKSNEWGSPNLGGGIVTAGGLVFIAAAMDTYLRGFDVETGKEIWKGQLPASAQATPMTYQANGKQYVVICAGGHGKLGTKMGDSVVAFALD